MRELIDRLEHRKDLTKAEFAGLIQNRTKELTEYLFERARDVREQHYGKDIYIRGLIEFTNYCKNDCYYCGIRCSNPHTERYRLSKDQIIACCKLGYALGFRTFVLQGGEDPYFTNDRLEDIIKSIKSQYADCALTLSIGERSFESYQRLYDAGADRYLLRHETANAGHYQLLHPKGLTLQSRMKCLEDLKRIGYLVGCGFMVGSPYQTAEHIAEDLVFLRDFQPHMVGIGPFLPQHDTPFADFEGGCLELVLFLLGLVRLMLPKVLLPATTALLTAHKRGRELGILAGANVVMPNLSPMDVREKYLLYDNKIGTGDEAAEGLSSLKMKMQEIGYQVVVSRGDAVY